MYSPSHSLINHTHAELLDMCILSHTSTTLHHMTHSYSELSLCILPLFMPHTCITLTMHLTLHKTEFNSWQVIYAIALHPNVYACVSHLHKSHTNTYLILTMHLPVPSCSLAHPTVVLNGCMTYCIPIASYIYVYTCVTSYIHLNLTLHGLYELQDSSLASLFV